MRGSFCLVEIAEDEYIIFGGLRLKLTGKSLLRTENHAF